MLEELNTEDKKTYGRAQIYDDDCKLSPNINMEPVVVEMENETIEISEDEKEFLKLPRSSYVFL